MDDPTKGPWFWVPGGQFIVSGVVGGDPATGLIVAEVPCGGGNPADGPVLAAAWELLEAAKAMDALMENLWKSVPWGKTFDLDVKALNTVPQQLKAAIEKASGQ